MGNKASSAKRGSASSVASSVTSAVSSLVSGGGSGDHSSLAAASNNHKAAKIRATPDMAALVESLVAAIERRARDRSDAVLARQSVLIKELEGVSSAVARLKSKTHDANSGAIQASHMDFTGGNAGDEQARPKIMRQGYPVPAELIGFIIGKGGANIDQIQNASSAKLSTKDDSGPRSFQRE